MRVQLSFIGSAAARVLRTPRRLDVKPHLLTSVTCFPLHLMYSCIDMLRVPPAP